MRNNVYLASTFDDFKRMQLYRDKLHNKHYKVTSSWIDYYTNDDNTPLTRKQAAQRDVIDVLKCNYLILFTDCSMNTSLGGKYVELGLALSYNICDGTLKKTIYLVGNYSNVFTHLVDKQFNNFSELLEYLPCYQQ